MVVSELFQIFVTKSILILSFFLITIIECNDIWEQDLSKDMEIGVSNDGYEKVSLLCGANSMQVELKSKEKFSGVIYTRGSFHKKQPPCFLDPGENGETLFTLKLPFDKCQTLQDGDIYSNVLVIQHDKELIMPGDSAFNLECDFSHPRDITVSADLNKERKPVSSRITLADPDPGAQNTDRYKRNTIENSSDTVVLTPADVHIHSVLRKDEL